MIKEYTSMFFLYVFQNKNYRRAILGSGRGVRVATKLRKNTNIIIIQSDNQIIAI